MATAVSPVLQTPTHLSTASHVRIAVLFLLAAILHYPVITDLAEDWWTEPESSYGMIVPPLAAYLAWSRRNSLFAIPAREDARGLILVALSCSLFLVGKLGAEYFLSRISIVILLTGLTWTFWGRDRLKALAFPFVLLATMVPLPTLIYNSIGIPLQLFSSSVATSIIQMSGGSVYRDGNIIELPGIALGVAEACSGLRSLASLGVASLIVGYLNCDRVRGRVLLVALALPLAIGVNVLRVTGTALLASYREEYAMGFYHSFQGWAVFVISFGLLYALSRLLHRVTD